MKLGFAIFGVLLILLIGATVLVSLLPKQSGPPNLGKTDTNFPWNKCSYTLH